LIGHHSEYLLARDIGEELEAFSMERTGTKKEAEKTYFQWLKDFHRAL